MADDDLLEKVHSLSDLELAVLLCLVNREHVLISTPPAAIDDLVQELQLSPIRRRQLPSVHDTRGLRLSSASPASAYPLNSTAGSISPFARTDSYFALSSHSNHRSSTPLSPRTFPPSPQIAHFVIAKNLDRAPRVVQIQALELLRTRRIFTRTGGEAHVTAHLNDFFAVAHWHNPEDGYVNLDEAEDRNNGDDETASTESVVKKASNDTTPSTALISDIEISQLAKLSQEVQIDIDILRYQMNIIAFLRMHRAVAGGITPAATKHLHQLVKIFLHRIRLTEPEKERSMQWGSQLEAVEALLEDVGPEEVMEEVLEMVTAPL
ncbi:hypothetical protein TrVFT333_000494 [Trichoderma virens FT-333]|nr:hypothetical protein TrVFT333_000494 [Trichoderma virens FT-333]